MLLLALIVDLFTQVLFTVIYNWVPDLIIGSNVVTSNAIRNVYTVLGLIANTVTAIVVALYLAAIFANRQPRAAAEETIR